MAENYEPDCNYYRKKYIGAHKSKTAQFASAIDNNVTSAFPWPQYSETAYAADNMAFAAAGFELVF